MKSQTFGIEIEIFQFTPLREGRREAALMLANSFISIHAPPRGATRRPQCSSGTAGYFNSRPSARGDSGAKPCNYYVSISIHAPPRGATLTTEGNPVALNISIHAPPRGATNRQHLHQNVAPISIHAPPRGATV